MKVKIKCKVMEKYTTGFWILKKHWCTLYSDTFDKPTFDVPIRSEAEFYDIKLGEILLVSFRRKSNGSLTPVLN